MCLLLAVGSLGQEAFTQEQPQDTPPERALASDLPLQHRRYLLYLYARLGKPKIAEQLAERILQESPGDKQTYLVLASMYLERKETEKALLNGQALVRLYPGDDQARYFLAAAHQQAGHFEEANRLFRTLKEEQFQGRLYPYEGDLASAALGAGDWYRAMQAYQELLNNHALSEDLRLKTRAILESIYREHLPQFSLQEEILWLDQGMLFRTLAAYQQQISSSQKLFTRFSHESIELDGGNGVIERSHANYDGAVGLESTFSRKWSTRSWLGGSESGLLGGASATRTFAAQREISLELQANERSLDGLLIESLDGRQYRLTLSGTYIFTHDWLAYGQIYGRQVHLRNHTLGEGVAGNFNLERVLRHETPNVRVGYRTYISTFSERPGVPPGIVDDVVSAPGGAGDIRTELVEGLVLDYLHRQGIYLRLEEQLSGFVYGHAMVGSDYAVELGSVEYYWQAGLRIFPRKSVEARVEGGYFSSATTSAQASEQWQLVAGLKLWF